MTIKNFLFLLGFLIPVLGYCQPQIQSPYSKFGLGDFRSGEMLSSRAMGGLSAIYHDRNNLNPMNPASFAFLGGTSLDVGVHAQNYTIQSNRDNQESKNWSGAMDNINLGLSLVNDFNRELEGRKSDWRFGVGIGLNPFTKVGYDVTTNQTVNDQIVNYKFTGSGGSYMINWGSAAKYKDFSFGVNLGFLLGKVSESQLNIFTDTTLNYFNNQLTKDYSYRGTSVKIGGIWDYRFKDKQKDNGLRGDVLTLGAYVQPGFKLKTTLDQRINRIFALTGTIDSILYSNEKEYVGRIPMNYSVGVGYSFKGLYRLGVNYEGANWSSFTTGFDNTRMEQSSRISIGYEKMPNIKAYDSYWKKMAFRTGFFYGKDPRFVNGTQIRYYGITIGGGFPVVLPRQDLAFLNLGLELGKTGIPTDLDQSYIKLSLSFSLTDKSWFYKQKYY